MKIFLMDRRKKHNRGSKSAKREWGRQLGSQNGRDGGEMTALLRQHWAWPAPCGSHVLRGLS